MPCVYSGALLESERGWSTHLFLERVSVKLKSYVDDKTCTHQDDTIEPLLEPSHRVILGNTVRKTNLGPPFLPLGDPHPRSPHHHIKVHPENTNPRIIPRPEIDVLLNAEPKVTRVRKVFPSEFVFLYFETAFKDFFSFGTADGDVDGNFFVAADAEGTDGVAGFGGDGCLAGELFEDFGGTGQTITGFAYANVLFVVRVGSMRCPSSENNENVLMTSFSIRSSFMGLVGVVFCSAWVELLA